MSSTRVYTCDLCGKRAEAIPDEDDHHVWCRPDGWIYLVPGSDDQLDACSTACAVKLLVLDGRAGPFADEPDDEDDPPPPLRVVKPS